MRRLCIVLLMLYRACLSPLLGPACRFHPTCSVYAQDAIERHGMVRGLMMAGWRLLKCHPFHSGGFDPVR
ncbi:MAG: membrane protein insertion efficiency factor YidD [Nitrospira defluvii]|nr:membrane protein insertion efficiency factor YidD [Nitrospira defluvii]